MEGEALGEVIDALVTAAPGRAVGRGGRVIVTSGTGLEAGPVATVARRAAWWRRASAPPASIPPELDARVLVGHALGIDHTALAVQSDRIVTAEERKSIAALRRAPARRTSRSPASSAARSSGAWRCGSTPDVLVPRPETETVVEAALAAVARDHAHGALRIADLGTGSGALLLALLSEFPEASGVGTDLSVAALDCRAGQRRTLGLDARAAISLPATIAAALMRPFDLVVSNPPYIAHAGNRCAGAGGRATIDPPCALDGGPDGLDGYRAIAADLPRLLSPRGRLVLELGAGQARCGGGTFANRRGLRRDPSSAICRGSPGRLWCGFLP